MTANFLSIPSILLYLITWLLIIRCVKASINSSDHTQKTNKIYYLLWFAALALHILSLHFPLFQGKALTLSFFSLGSYVMWFLSLVLFVITLRRKIQSLAIFILPFTIVSILLTILNDSSSDQIINMRSGLGLHILVSLLAYSILMLASFQAVLLASQNNKLHSHQTTGFTRNLPSLEDMEHLLFRLIGIGVVLLSFALLTGFYYLDNLFGSGIAHKTILSIIAWLIFSGLLLGRWRFGWRGRTAIRWTLAGFIVLMLAFFGTKFIQEFILN